MVINSLLSNLRQDIIIIIYQHFEKRGLDWPIYVPSGAEVNAPEQHATSPTESIFDLPLAVSGSNESPNQIQHNAHAYYSTRVPTCWENTACLSNLCPVGCRSQSTWAIRDMAHRVQFWSGNGGKWFKRKPNYTLHDAYAQDWPPVPTWWENRAWLPNLCPVRCTNQCTWVTRNLTHRV